MKFNLLLRPLDGTQSVKIVSDWRVDAIGYLEPHIIYYARRYQCKETTMEDYLQELTFHLWKKLPQYKALDGPHPGLKTWASTVMRLKCIDIARYRQRSRQRGRPPKKSVYMNNGQAQTSRSS